MTKLIEAIIPVWFRDRKSKKSRGSSQVQIVLLRKSLIRGILANTIRFFCSFTVATLRFWAPDATIDLVISLAMAGYSTWLLKWRTAVRIRTFGWRRPDLVSLSMVYSIPRSFIPKFCAFGRTSKAFTPRQLWHCRSSCCCSAKLQCTPDWIGQATLFWFKVIVSS